MSRAGSRRSRRRSPGSARCSRPSRASACRAPAWGPRGCTTRRREPGTARRPPTPPRRCSCPRRVRAAGCSRRARRSRGRRSTRPRRCPAAGPPDPGAGSLDRGACASSRPRSHSRTSRTRLRGRGGSGSGGPARSPTGSCHPAGRRRSTAMRARRRRSGRGAAGSRPLCGCPPPRTPSRRGAARLRCR